MIAVIVGAIGQLPFSDATLWICRRAHSGRDAGGIAYDLCPDGNGYGLLFAIAQPHDSKMCALGIHLPLNTRQNWIFNLINLARSWLALAAPAHGTEIVVRLRRSRRAVVAQGSPAVTL